MLVNLELDMEDIGIARVYTEEMRDIIPGIPKLVKACKGFVVAEYPIGNALKAMGVE